MKKNILVVCILFLGILSSCGVYSLYPIFTPDTLVQKDEVIGKWLSDTSEGDFIIFSSVRYSIGNAGNTSADGDKDSDIKMEISFSSEDGSVIDTGDYVIENGDTTIWKDTIRAQFNDLVKIKMDKLGDYQIPSKNKEDDYYLMEFYESGDLLSSFKAHFVEIGDDLFIDLYPQGGLDDENGASENYFPVHTFLKVDLSGEKMVLNIFDQKKLKNLFESNLIRMRHEIVDDKVLITAQPKEIQKFLDKYSDDESVFKDPTLYTKVAP